VREISERFAHAAQEQQEKAAQIGDGSRPSHPIAVMAFSKSHIDRVLKAQVVPSPLWPFTHVFLKITNRAAGLTQDEHQQRCHQARALIRAIESSAHLPAPGQTDSISAQHETIVALRLEVDLQRALHTETRLRYALRDAQFLMTTLWHIISALRDLISGHHLLEARAYHSGTHADEVARLRDETEQSIDHKRTAHEEADRVATRITKLEALWEQARGEVQRLAVHPDAAGFTHFTSDQGTAPHPVLAQDLLAQPALDDIAAALTRARTLNAQEDRTAEDLEESLAPGEPLHDGDVLAILVAATRLTDRDTRRTAVRTLCRDWPLLAETKDVLVRLINDEDPVIVGMAVDGLVKASAGDVVIRDVLIRRLGDGEDFDVDAFDGLVRGWAGDAIVRDVLIRLLGDGEDSHAVVAAGLAEAWAGDSIARDALFRLARVGSEGVRRAATEGLVEGWPADRAAHAAVDALLSSDNENVRSDAIDALTKAWAGDPHTRDTLVRIMTTGDINAQRVAARALFHGRSGTDTAMAAIIRLCRDNDERIRRTAVSLLARDYPGDHTARDTVISLLHDDNPRVPPAAARALAQGWAGDTVARDALVLLTQDGNLRARRTAARVLAEGWPDDAIVHDVLSGLAREDRHKRVRGAAARLLAAIREPGN
jgi:hypothetical protein